MLTLAILFLFQGVTSVYDQITFRMNGKVFVGQSEPAMVDVVLKDANGEVIAVKQSFSNGTFWFDNLTFGRYSVAVANPKYKLVEFPVLMREPRDTAKTVVINLEPIGGAPNAMPNAAPPKVSAATAPSPAASPSALLLPPGPDLDLEALKTIKFDDLFENNPADAVEEFRLGVEAIQKPVKDNPPDEHFKKAIAIAPEFYEAHLQLGLELKRRGNPKDAILSLEKAISTGDSPARALSVLGGLYFESQQFQKAVDTLLKLGPIAPFSAEDRFALGSAFYRLNRLAAAEQQLLVAIQLAPGKMPQAYVQLHNIYMKGQNPVAGLRALEDYLRLFPQAPDFKDISDRAQKLRELLKIQ